MLLTGQRFPLKKRGRGWFALDHSQIQWGSIGKSQWQ